MAQQTAVDWLVEQLIPEDQHEGIMDIIEDAKQREKEQITDAVIFGVEQLSDSGDLENENRAEQYYNELYQLRQDKADK